MAELIDREELRERIYERFGRQSTKVIATVEEGRIMSDWAFLEPFLNAAKTVDAEPIVRCGECCWMNADGSCDCFADSRIRPSVSDFCSYGERRDDG